MSRYFMSTMQVSLMGGYFFQIFGEVTGVNILAGNRVTVNFKKDLAARMTGSLVQVRDRRREVGALPSLQVPWDRLHCVCSARSQHCTAPALYCY